MAMTEAPYPARDEFYCYSCGSIVKRLAEICMRCGVRVRGVVGEGVDAGPRPEAPPGPL